MYATWNLESIHQQLLSKVTLTSFVFHSIGCNACSSKRGYKVLGFDGWRWTSFNWALVRDLLLINQHAFRVPVFLEPSRYLIDECYGTSTCFTLCCPLACLVPSTLLSIARAQSLYMIICSFSIWARHFYYKKQECTVIAQETIEPPSHRQRLSPACKWQ